MDDELKNTIVSRFLEVRKNFWNSLDPPYEDVSSLHHADWRNHYVDWVRDHYPVEEWSDEEWDDVWSAVRAALPEYDQVPFQPRVGRVIIEN